MTTIDRGRCAVLVMDFQAGILGMLGDAAAPVVERATAVVSAARAAGIPVMYVVVGFRPGYPEVNPRNPSFGPVVQSGRFVTETPGSDVHPALKPEATDVVIVKHRVGAFAATDLDLILRSKSIDTLILLGISTSGVILSTVRHASDADYRLLVVSDGCADRDAEVHGVLMGKVLARQATVLTSAEVIEQLR
jgi:nicotinamidase-related amidase